MRKTWSRAVAWLALLGVAACAAAFTYLALTRSLEKDAGLWVQGAIVLIGVGAAAAHIVTNTQPTKVRGLGRWLAPRRIATLFAAVVAGFGAVSLALPLFAPPNAVEDHPRQILTGVEKANEGIEDVKGGVNELNQRLAPKPFRALENIAGFWGEPGCTVVYRFERRDQALFITLLQREPGMVAYEMVAEIDPHGEGDVLRADVERSTASDEDFGDSLVFTYSDNGATERLSWLNKGHNTGRDTPDRAPVPLPLVRCEAPR